MKLMAHKSSRGRIIDPAQVKEDLRRHVGDASQRLRAGGAVSDQQIHDARKDLKRSRASLRLLRAIIGKRAYTRENAALRDAARPLSAVRDAKVVMDALDALLEPGTTRSQRILLQTVHTELEREMHAARETLRAGGAPGSSAKALERVWKRVDRWRVARKSAPRLLLGLEQIYRRGRKALADVEADPSAENLHEWRKQVKYLGNAMEILSTSGARTFGKPMKHADSVASALGDDHDLAVLMEKIAGVHSGPRNAHRASSSRIAQRRAKLKSKALRKGRALYKLKPKAFMKRVQRNSKRSTRRTAPAQPTAHPAGATQVDSV